MENVKVLIDGVQKDVSGLFYIYDSKYYFIYTEKELDENDYVILYMAQVGKETKNTENGPVDTGYMVGVEISNPEEQQKVQASVSYIVEDKKNNTSNPQIQYLPMSMLTNLKIVSKKRFRLLKSIMVDNFKLQFDSVTMPINNNILQLDSQPAAPVAEIPNVINPQPIQPIVAQPLPEINNAIPEPVAQPLAEINNTNLSNQSIGSTQIDENNNLQSNTNNSNVNVIVDYRTKYFEEEEKNKELQAQIELLTQKLNEIKKVIE